MMGLYNEKIKDIREGNLAVITDIQRFSVHDGPGIRTMVFFKGCPLRCQWCQNPETWNREPELMYFQDNCIGCGNCQRACPTGTLALTENGVTIDRQKCIRCGSCAKQCFPGALKTSGRFMTEDQLVYEIMKDEVFYRKSGGGVTLSGGECTTFAVFIEKLLARVREMGVHTAIETCGFCDPERFRRIIAHVDLLLYDIKVPRSGPDRIYTGQSCDRILENLRMARSMDKEVVLRFPMIPGVNNDPETLKTIIEVAKSNRIQDINILPFHKMGSGKWRALGRTYVAEDRLEPTDDEIAFVKKVLLDGGLRATVGGGNV